MKHKLLYIIICFFCLISCDNETKVEHVHLNPTELNLNIGESYQIEMLIEPISAIIYNPVSWHTSNPNVAQVDNKGNVTARYAGECLIIGKTKHHEAYCKVTVRAPKYQIEFTKAILFDEGIKLETNQRNLILRLYNDNLTIDSTGAMTGNGLFLNINLYAPFDSKQLPFGNYETSDTINDFTILPGALRQENNTYYATGSYLGEYSDNGLSAIFLTKGNVSIENSSNYEISCSFTGQQKESIKATFNGSIDIYDTSQENKITIIEYNDAKTESIELTEEPNLNHVKISLSNNDTIVTFVARTPKSIKTLPKGNYYLSDNTIAYTLVPKLCNISSKNTTSTLLEATLQITENEYNATFVDNNGIKYKLQPIQKSKNIVKQQLKSFEY